MDGDLRRGHGTALPVHREAQGAYAAESLKPAKTANEDSSFAAEMVPVKVKSRKGDVEIARDEQPFTADISKIPA